MRSTTSSLTVLKARRVLRWFVRMWMHVKLLLSSASSNSSQGSEIKETLPWPHADQNPNKPDFQMVQGIVNLLPNGIDDGGYVCMPRSHAQHRRDQLMQHKHDDEGNVIEHAFDYDRSRGEDLDQLGSSLIYINLPYIPAAIGTMKTTSSSS